MKFMGPEANQRSLEYARLIASQNTPNKAKVLASQKVKGGYKLSSCVHTREAQFCCTTAKLWRTDLNPIIQQYSDVQLRPDWETVKYNVMRAAVMNKFLQNPRLLLETGNAYLVEVSPKDYIWGIGKDGTGLTAPLGVVALQRRVKMP